MPRRRNTETINIKASSGNVFADLGLKDAEERQTKVKLAVALNRILAAMKLSQVKAAERLGVNQPKVSALKNYKLEGFSVERLLDLVTALSNDVEIIVHPRPHVRKPGRITVRSQAEKHSRIVEDHKHSLLDQHPRSESCVPAEDFWRDVFSPTTEVLKGARVLLVAESNVGRSCSWYLAELGAEVITIEAPRRGEALRHTTPSNEPFLYPLSKYVPERGTGLEFLGANTNEYFCSIDFRRPEGQNLIRKLAAKADVVVDTVPPGVLEGWSIGYPQLRQVNPRLVYCSLSDLADLIAETDKQFAASPLKQTAIWLVDYWSGITAGVQVVAALRWRNQVSRAGSFVSGTQTGAAVRPLQHALASLESPVPFVTSKKPPAPTRTQQRSIPVDEDYVSTWAALSPKERELLRRWNA